MPKLENKITIDKIEGVVRVSGSGGHIMLPKSWVGKEVIVRLKK